MLTSVYSGTMFVEGDTTFCHIFPEDGEVAYEVGFYVDDELVIISSATHTAEEQGARELSFHNVEDNAHGSYIIGSTTD